MSLLRTVPLLLVTGTAFAAGDGFMIGGGLEGDTDDGLVGALIGGMGLSQKTWLSAGLAASSTQLGNGQDLDTVYAQLELDHSFEPLGVRFGAGYWGDKDVLESRDWRVAVYWRGERAMVSADYERRDFDLTTPGTDVSPGREIAFDADGVGASLRFDIGEQADLRISGMAYDYSVPFRPIQDRDVIDLISVSRLSLINSLVDNRARITLGIDHGQRRWEIEVATSEGAVVASRRKSYTLRYLTPMTGKSDIEFGLGYDDSDVFGEVTFLSLYLYFYGGD